MNYTNATGVYIAEVQDCYETSNPDDPINKQTESEKKLIK